MTEKISELIDLAVGNRAIIATYDSTEEAARDERVGEYLKRMLDVLKSMSPDEVEYLTNIDAALKSFSEFAKGRVLKELKSRIAGGHDCEKCEERGRCPAEQVFRQLKEMG